MLSSEQRKAAARKVVAAQPGRRERKREETREKLFRAALKLFAKHGFNDTTVEAITEAADVGKGTFFNYFPTKEHVLIALAELQLGKLQGAVARAREGSDPIREVLRDVLIQLYEKPGHHPGLIRALLTAGLGGEPVRSLMSEKMLAGRELLREIFVIGQQRGEVRRDREAAELARAMQQLGFGGMVLWAIHPQGALVEMAPAAFESFWNGVQGAREKKERKS